MQWTRRLWAMALASLSAIPPTLGRTEALAIIAQADRASLGAQAASVGSSLYDGEKISTDDSGILQLRSGPVQFNLLGGSVATVRGNADVETQTFTAELAKGTAVMTSPAGAKSEICALGASIRAAQGGPLTVQVSVTGPKELRIYVRRGAALLMYHGETATIAEGSSYTVALDPPNDPPNNGSSPNSDLKPGAKRINRLLLIATAATAAAIIIPVTHTHGQIVSPDRP